MGPVCLAKRRGVLGILTKSVGRKGSGFPLRRERRVSNRQLKDPGPLLHFVDTEFGLCYVSGR